MDNPPGHNKHNNSNRLLGNVVVSTSVTVYNTPLTDRLNSNIACWTMRDHVRVHPSRMFQRVRVHPFVDLHQRLNRRRPQRLGRRHQGLFRLIHYRLHTYTQMQPHTRARTRTRTPHRMHIRSHARVQKFSERRHIQEGAGLATPWRCASAASMYACMCLCDFV